jgi:hypothetical protein
MGDPLNPIVPIQPLAPEPVDSTRIQRIAREQQRESAPDWQTPGDDTEGEREQQFEDDYDPDWGKWETVEAVADDEPAAEPDRAWDPALGHDRRGDEHATGYDSTGDGLAGDDDERPGPHIDITA